LVGHCDLSFACDSRLLLHSQSSVPYFITLLLTCRNLKSTGHNHSKQGTMCEKRKASPVATENSIRSENKEVPINREIMVATTMSSLFVALFALVASSFRTRAALQAEILALRHQLAVLQKNAPRRLRFHRCDRFLWVVLSRF